MADSDDIAALVGQAEAFLGEVAGDELLTFAAPTLMNLGQVIERAARLRDIRGAKGHGLGQATRRQLEQIHDQLARVAAIIRGEA